MIDYFALALTHGLLLLGAWRMLGRVDLDREEPIDPAAPPAEQAPPTSTKSGLRTRA